MGFLATVIVDQFCAGLLGVLMTGTREVRLARMVPRTVLQFDVVKIVEVFMGDGSPSNKNSDDVSMGEYPGQLI
jgi:hypothetical protein